MSEANDITGAADRVRVEDPARILPDLARWIRTHYHTKKWARLELRHLSTSGADHVETWEEFEGVEPAQILRNVYNAAKEDGQNFRGVQRYGVFFYELDKNQPMRKLFTVKGAEWDEDDGFGAESEPANAKGLLAQHMRFTSDIMRTAMTGTREQAHILKTLLGEVLGINERLMSKHLEVLDLHEKLLDKTVERDIKREDEKSVREVKKMVTGLIAQQGIQMLPMLMNKLMGGASGGEAAPAVAMPPMQATVVPQQVAASQGMPNITGQPPAPPQPPVEAAAGSSDNDRILMLVKRLVATFRDVKQVMGVMAHLRGDQKDCFVELHSTAEAATAPEQVARVIFLVKSLVGALLQEQIMAMMDSFSEDQKQVFVELYRELLEQHQREVAAAQAAAAQPHATSTESVGQNASASPNEAQAPGQVPPKDIQGTDP